MKLTPAQFRICLAALATALGFCIQYQLVPANLAPLAAVAATFLAGIVTPPKKETP